MSTASDGLILEYLQQMRVGVEQLVDELDGLKLRMTAVLEGLGSLDKQVDRLLDLIKENAK